MKHFHGITSQLSYINTAKKDKDNFVQENRVWKLILVKQKITCVISKIEKMMVNTNQKQIKRLVFSFTSYIYLF